MKKSGPRHTFAERRLMKQVATEFRKKWNELGSGKRAAEELGVNPKSFYKYAAGTDLPRIEVLCEAQKKWKIKWDPLFDTSRVFRVAKPTSPEQLVLPMIRSVREEDIRVVEVSTADDSSLNVVLKIRFFTEKSHDTKKNRVLV